MSVADSTLASERRRRSGAGAGRRTRASPLHAAGTATDIEVDGSQATVDRQRDHRRHRSRCPCSDRVGCRGHGERHTIDGRGSSAVHGSDGRRSPRAAPTELDLPTRGRDVGRTARGSDAPARGARGADRRPGLRPSAADASSASCGSSRRPWSRGAGAAIDGYAVAAVVEPTPVPEPSGDIGRRAGRTPSGRRNPARPAAVPPLAERVHDHASSRSPPCRRRATRPTWSPGSCTCRPRGCASGSVVWTSLRPEGWKRVRDRGRDKSGHRTRVTGPRQQTDRHHHIHLSRNTCVVSP